MKQWTKRYQRVFIPTLPPYTVSSVRSSVGPVSSMEFRDNHIFRQATVVLLYKGKICSKLISIDLKFVVTVFKNL